ncbi:hypothetical protein GMOD_00001377 [Pyrenophora seminiperda CCB06]|uniref:Uncharacterized protein n=1 Tax=Pyrenophora seminiperda CCB06 TaxID=1302712 RepID=A0A3M7LZ50_9PLEO|nr:hypothetical protein GMOD_00001377 [Pyrenophora seminiperda CCB06]
MLLLLGKSHAVEVAGAVGRNLGLISYLHPTTRALWGAFEFPRKTTTLRPARELSCEHLAACIIHVSMQHQCHMVRAFVLIIRFNLWRYKIVVCVRDSASVLQSDRLRSHRIMCGLHTVLSVPSPSAIPTSFHSCWNHLWPHALVGRMSARDFGGVGDALAMTPPAS